MSFCFLYNVVLENHNVQNSPWGGGGSIASSRSITKRQLEINLKSKANTKHAALDIRLLDMMVHHPMLEFTEAKMLWSSS